MSTWWRIISRKKKLSPEAVDSDTQLARILSLFDLTALGVGSTLGVGVYVLAGQVAKDTAGPSVVISFIIAAIASVFAALCYAEFGARVPRAGSAYIYSYVCVGELIAFIIGWNLILEYVIGSASVARGLSLYLDTLLNDTLKTTFRQIAPMHSSYLAEYFDFFSFGITLVLGVALAFGLKKSSCINNIFASLNILVVVFVIVAGSFKADPKNWNIKKSDIPLNITHGGEGGFFPFGISGTIKGAATCFYGFIGFDCIATTGEEVRNPKRAIPISIMLSLFITFLAYFGTSAIVTLMVPYYLQDPSAVIPHAFQLVGWEGAKWIAAIGGMFGLLPSLFGAMFPLPRIIYAMANDALVFRFLGNISPKYHTPVVGTLLAALLTGLMSALFELRQLVNMMSIGTLMAYTIVAACVIILRYTPNDLEEPEENLELIPPHQEFTVGNYFKQMFNCNKRKANCLTQKLVTLQVFIFIFLSLALALCLMNLESNLVHGEIVAIVPISVITVLIMLVLLSIWVQPKSKSSLSFKVPLVPLIPALSIMINLYLMTMLDTKTWIRFGIWMAVGLPMYIACCFLYPKPAKSKSKSKTGFENPNFTFTTQPNGNHEPSSNGVQQQQNGTKLYKKKKSLTIPEIRIQRPSTVDPKLEEAVVQESGTIKIDRFTSVPDLQVAEMYENLQEHRKGSMDEVNEAVLELDQVLKDSELQEAINPENSDRFSVNSSDSESGKSEEHHVEAVVHQEDGEEIVDLPEDFEISENELILDRRDDLESPEGSTNIQNVTEAQEELEALKDDENGVKSVPEGLSKDPEACINTTSSPEDLKSEETNWATPKTSSEPSNEIADQIPSPEATEIDDVFIPVPPPIPDFLDNSSINSKISSGTRSNSSTDSIPPPPPLAGLFLQIPRSKSYSTEPDSASTTPRKIYHTDQPSIVTPENLSKVVLKPTPTTRRPRTESVISVESITNLTSGTDRFERFKSKLNEILTARKVSKGPGKYDQSPTEERPPPMPAKEIELIDQVLEQYEEEIPTNFGKTKEFKDSLNFLLQRRQSEKIEKPVYVRKYEQQKSVPVTENDVEKHRELLKNSLNSLKLRKSGLKVIDVEYQDAEDKNKKEEDKEVSSKVRIPAGFLENKENDGGPEMSQEKHKKLMIATLRQIKLRKTGLNLSEETDEVPR